MILFYFNNVDFVHLTIECHFWLNTYAAIIKRVLGRDCNIIEEAITIIFGFHSMVAWWTNDRHSILNIVPQNAVNQFDGTANGQLRKLKCCLRIERFDQWNGKIEDDLLFIC